MKKDIEIGSTLKALRVKKKLTQAQLADIVFLTPQAISKWERNNSFPDIPTLVLLSELYGVSTDEILGRSKKSFLMSIFSRKKRGGLNMFDKLYRLTNPNMYQFTVEKESFNMDDYPELQEMGIWIKLDKGVYKLIIPAEVLKADTNLNDMNYVKDMFQVITNLNNVEIERAYQAVGFYAL